MRRTLAFLTVAAALTLAALPSAAQSVRGQLTGTVTDASGLAMAGVTVTAANQATNVYVIARTSERGTYEFSSLLPGSYTVTVESQGFSKAVVRDIVVNINQWSRADIVLQVGTVRQEVVVEAPPVVVPTDQAELGQVIDSKMLAELPLPSRNFLGLITLTPGVVSHSNGPGKFRSEITGYGGGFSMAGGRTTSVQYLIDGVSNNDPNFQTPAMSPSMDAIQEVKIATSMYSADLGGASGQVNIAVRSGTNALHGSVFDFHRNSALQPKRPGGTYRDQLTGEPYKSPFLRNQFGATVGGPVVKDKAFFFFDYEGVRQRSGSTSLVTVPTAAQRAGDFSEVNAVYGVKRPIYDPLTTRTDPANASQILRDPFPGSVVPSNRFNAVTKKIQDFYPAPNLATRVGTANAAGTTQSLNNLTQVHGRIDYNFSERDNIFGRLSYFTEDAPSNPLMPYTGTAQKSHGYNSALQWNHTFSPVFLSEFRLGYVRPVYFLGYQTGGVSQEALGLHNPSPYQPSHETLPLITVTGLAGMGYGGSIFDTVDNAYELAEAVTLIKSQHSLKFGVGLRRRQARWIFPSVSNGQLSFLGNFSSLPSLKNTGDPFADFALGYPQTLRQRALPSFASSRAMAAAFYIQDNWKISRNLTLDLGLRYEVTQPDVTQDHAGMVPDGGVPGGRVMVANEPYANAVDSERVAYDPSLPPGVVPTDRNNFAPRVGIAWRPFGGSRVVLRSGYGIFYDGYAHHYYIGFKTQLYTEVADQTINLAPASPVVPVEQLAFPDPVPIGKLGSTPFNVSVFERNQRDPYTQRWSFAIDYTFRSGYLLEASYVGSHGVKLPWQRQFNQAPLGGTLADKPQSRAPYGNLNVASQMLTNSNSSSYNAGMLRLERRFAAGLAFSTAYTWSKNLDYVSSDVFQIGPNANNAQDSYHLYNERGPASFDIPHRFFFNGVYELPFGRGRRLAGDAGGIVGKLISDWQLSGVFQVQSGYRHTLTTTGDIANVGSPGVQRANQVGEPFPSGWTKTGEHWLDPTAFAVPARLTFGNTMRGLLLGPTGTNTDASLAKTTAIGERLRVQFRAEAFNVFAHRVHAMHRTFGNNVVTSASFGYIGTRDTLFNPRVWQLGLRMTF